MQSLLGFVTNGKGVVTAQKVLRHDVLPWVFVVAFFTFLNWAIIQLILISTGIHNEYALIRVREVISGYRLLIVGLLGCLCLVRSKGWQLWMVFAAGVMWYFLGGTGYAIGGMWLPLLNFLLVPVAVLAIGRLIEYVRMRYSIKLTDVRLTSEAIMLYILVAIGALVLQVL